MPFVNLLDAIYPIGSLYISFSNVSPAENIGGQWEPIIGRFPYFSDKIETGGENTHTLTINEMPSHDHQTLQNNNDGTISAWALTSINGNAKKNTVLQWEKVGVNRTITCPLINQCMLGEE